MSITLNILRNGNITSSEAVALTAVDKSGIEFGEKAWTYIAKKNHERRLGRSVSLETDARPLSWGKFVEQGVFDQLGTEYQMTSQETIVHPTVENWAGSPDAFRHLSNLSKRVVCDFKAPYTLESFCTLVQPLYDGLIGMDAMNAIRNGYTDKRGFQHQKHKDGEKFYWQLVSNGCISDCDVAELIVYCPYQSEIAEIQSAAFDSSNSSYMFIYYAKLEELPFLIDGGYYKNINTIQFEIPANDKLKLKTLVKKASQYLISA